MGDSILMGDQQSDVSLETSHNCSDAMELEPENRFASVCNEVGDSTNNLVTQCSNGTILGCGCSVDTHNNGSPFDPLAATSQDIPFGNGEWLPVKPEREGRIYWWSFPWTYKLHSKYDWEIDSGRPQSVWKLIAGNKTTHLPEHCLDNLTPKLSEQLFQSVRVAPQVVDFGSQYESVLEYFTERMLGLNDYVPAEKVSLLNKLFDETGYRRDMEIRDLWGFVPNLYPI